MTSDLSELDLDPDQDLGLGDPSVVEDVVDISDPTFAVFADNTGHMDQPGPLGQQVVYVGQMNLCFAHADWRKGPRMDPLELGQGILTFWLVVGPSLVGKKRLLDKRHGVTALVGQLGSATLAAVVVVLHLVDEKEDQKL